MKTYGRAKARPKQEELDRMKAWEAIRLNTSKRVVVPMATRLDSDSDSDSDSINSSDASTVAEVEIKEMKKCKSSKIAECREGELLDNKLLSERLANVTLERNLRVSDASTDSILAQSAQTKVVEDTSIHLEDDETEKSLIDLLSICDQKQLLSFEEYFEGSYPSRKIGEASYSDVYLTTLDGEQQAIKIIPIGEEDQLSVNLAWLEVAVTRRIGTLVQRQDDKTSNFVKIKRAAVVTGIQDGALQRLWDLYDIKNDSENLDPRDYDDDQLYLIIAMEFAGSDLEHTTLLGTQKVERAISVLMQICLSLAQAESQLLFESRDLVLAYLTQSIGEICWYPPTRRLVFPLPS